MAFLPFYETGQNNVYNCRVDVDVDIWDQKIWAVSNASLYGSGFAWGRLYDDFEPSSSGTHDVTCEYDIQGYVRNATCDVYLFAREPGQGPQRKRIDVIDTGIDNTRTRTETFDLEAGEQYDIGVELYTEAAAGGDPAAVADFYNTTALNGRRHFTVDRFTIEEG
jgi:hypothetical protein